MDPEISKILERFPSGKRDMLIPLLQAIQTERGFLSGEILEQVGSYLNIPSNKVQGVATFYDQFRFRPNGKFHFQVCQGTSCHVFGNTNLLHEMEKQLRVKAGSTTRDGLISLEVVTCLGACEQGPVVMVNNRPHRKVTPESLSKILESIKE
jgi:NADH-quinone oxidoreductase E subunit